MISDDIAVRPHTHTPPTAKFGVRVRVYLYVVCTTVFLINPRIEKPNQPKPTIPKSKAEPDRRAPAPPPVGNYSPPPAAYRAYLCSRQLCRRRLSVNIYWLGFGNILLGGRVGWEKIFWSFFSPLPFAFLLFGKDYGDGETVVLVRDVFCRSFL
jgi:hypothetical protein